MRIIVYAQPTGEILRCIDCPPNSADIQCAEGEAWIEHDPVRDEDFIVDLETLTVTPRV